jgi:predicted dehydrogenase
MARPDGPLRVAVIGLGFGQQVHVPAFRADPRCEVTTLCATRAEKATQVAGRLNVPRSSGNWREVIADPEVDAVSIAVPPRFQPEIAAEALRQGKAVFCEKPLAANVHDALAVRRAAGQNLPNLLNFEFCECDGWLALQKAISAGMSRFDSIEVDWRVRTFGNQRRLDNWKSTPDAGGGALQAFVAHTFYLIEQIKGAISRLKATLKKADDDPREGETEVALEAEFLGGGRATIFVATDAAPPHHHQIEVVGTGRRLRLLNEGSDYISGFQLFSSGFQPPGTPLWPRPDGWQELTPKPAAPTIDGRIEATSRLVRKFVDWALEGKPAQPNFADGYRVQYLIEVARRSNAEGRWMDAIE